MSKHHHNTALLVFSRSAKAEIKDKKLCFDDRKSESLAALMIEQTRQVVEDSGLPFYFFSEKKQIGDTFGERLTHAFETLFSKGYEQVIAIGNDCLTLTADDLHKATTALSDNTDVVLGEATDGGAYLIGYRRAAFETDAFKGLNWQTPSVFLDLASLAQAQDFTLVCLAEKADVDTAQALFVALNSLSVRLKKAIIQILFALQTVVLRITNPFLSAFNPTNRLLRGPPCF